MKRNAGFSLIELMVTLAIMAVLSTGTVVIVLSRSNWESKKAAQQISDALNETRAQALAKTGAWMQIDYDDAEGYILKTSYASEEVLGKKLEISYESDSGTVVIDRNSGPLILSYERASGSFLPLISSVTETRGEGDYKIFTYTYVDGGGKYCKKITISRGSRSPYELELNRVTGRHSVE